MSDGYLDLPDDDEFIGTPDSETLNLPAPKKLQIAHDSQHGDIDSVLNFPSPGVVLEEEEEKKDKAKPKTSKSLKKYTPLHEIARGGMGKIILWRDNNIRRVVAAKLMLNKEQGSLENCQRFFEEGQITGQLEHPNIIPIHEIGLDRKNNLYITMKYMKGGESLDGLLKKIKRDPKLAQREWSTNKVLRRFLGICYAIDYAHSKKVIHRDLKPENIMLGNFGEVMVMDWGLAKVIGRKDPICGDDSVTTVRSQGGFQTLHGRVSGTPLYMAPEQARGDAKNIGFRSDIYSLGGILYEMMSGYNCIKESDIETILRKVAKGKIDQVPKKGLFGPIPKEIRAIIKKALSHSPDRRYPSVREFIEDIQRFIDGKEVGACRYTIFDKIAKNIKQYRKELSLVLGTILIFVSSLVVWSKHSKEAKCQVYVKNGLDKLESSSFAKKLKNLENFQNRILAKEPGTSYKYIQGREQARQEFESILKTVSKTVTYYQKAYDIIPRYEYKKLQAKAWFELFNAAVIMKNQSWRGQAHNNVKNLLKARDYETEYYSRMVKYSTFHFKSEPKDAVVYLYKFEEAGKWYQLVPFPYKVKEQKTIRTLKSNNNRAVLHGIVSDDALVDRPQNIKLAEGSYLIIWKKPSFESFRYLLNVTEKKEAQTIAVKLHKKDPVLKEFVFVPKTKFLAGGDAVGALAKRQIESGPFYLQKKEITFLEYLAFLKDFVKNSNNVLPFFQELIQEQQKRLKYKSKDSEKTEHFMKSLLDRSDGIGLLNDYRKNLVAGKVSGKVSFSDQQWRAFFSVLIPKTFKWPIFFYENGEFRTHPVWKRGKQGWKKWPVYGINKFSCELYALWRSVKDKRRYRLPTELEWELAARGADGRTYSWGRMSWPKAAKRNGGYGVSKITADEINRQTSDVSPWGVYDLGGSLGEWTSSMLGRGYFTISSKHQKALDQGEISDKLHGWFAKHKTALSAKASIEVQEKGSKWLLVDKNLSYKIRKEEKKQQLKVYLTSYRKTYVIKGNVWGLAPEGMKCAFRVGETEHYFHPTLGFRLATEVSANNKQ